MLTSANKAFAPAFVKAGVKAVVLVATNADKLKTVETALKAINPNLETLVVAANIADTASVASLFSQVKARFGHANILVNNAGVINGPGMIADADPEQWWSNFVSWLQDQNALFIPNFIPGNQYKGCIPAGPRIFEASPILRHARIRPELDHQRRLDGLPRGHWLHHQQACGTEADD